MLEVYLLALILFASGLIHGLVGFAFALTALPLIALLKELKFAIPLLSLFSFTINLVMLFLLKEKRIFKIPLRFFGVIALGVFLGVKGFTLSSEFTLRLILVLAILIFTFWELFQLKSNQGLKFVKNIDPEVFRSPRALFTAFLVGFLGGLLNTPGPPIVIYLTLLHFDKNIFKATLQLIFAFSSLNAAFNHYLSGNLSPQVFQVFLFNLPLVLIGMFLGQKVYTKIGNRVYYYLVNLFLLISALLLLLRPHG